MRFASAGRAYEGPEPAGPDGRRLLARWRREIGKSGIGSMVLAGRSEDAAFIWSVYEPADALNRDLLRGWTCDGGPIDYSDGYAVAFTALEVAAFSGFFGQSYQQLMARVAERLGLDSPDTSSTGSHGQAE